MNVGEATVAVQQRGFDYLSPERVLLMLNTAKDTFEDQWAWPWLENQIVAPTPLALADLKLVLYVKNAATNSELLGLDARQVSMDGTDIDIPGTPEFWFIEGAYDLRCWPGNGATLKVVYVADSPELVAPGDTPLIPSRYHSLWIDYAVAEAYKDADNFAAAQALRADVMTRTQDVILRYETRNRQHSPFMTVRTVHGDD